MSTNSSGASLLRFGPPASPRRRLFCFPFAGGGPSTFRLWHRSLPDDVEALAIQLRRSEHPLDSVAAIVDAVRPLVEDASDLPFAFFGHSMGALVAFELTVALEGDGGRSPSHLFVSARRAPDEFDHATPVHDLPQEQFLDELDRRFAAVPDAVRREPDLLELLLPALRADIRAIETYAPLTADRVQCPVRVYGGADDRHPRPEQLAGWQRVAEQAVRVRTFPGDHFYLNSQRDALTADIVSQWTDAAVAAEPR
jgi:medium-chain acyl-[acyl-carrier-protein] hydrolase